ncbi:(Fe-S)-binding protein [Heliophilum fasciatum]|uniref:Putative Fe-S cluster-containing protein n=1 Tax=Heliophilum fasciatum TaxID=35700 RepID=A0A4R2RWX1_9FIRM|nr:(Fe-S)-binding protein [Heliophilum fasciatum]MCW2276648.1 putative Fe-S cluster-containing protein [Heliophilum fasciatum]TCP68970.1 putative Fe-S cluster-containing protein [Heliophilum fasciatum]
MHSDHAWLPPGKNCGLCGEPSCKSFLRALAGGRKSNDDCPFYTAEVLSAHRPSVHPPSAGCGCSEHKCSTCHCAADAAHATNHQGVDVLGNPYHFVLAPLPGEISARKIVLPFRADLVEKFEIRPGDHVLGRPMGAGCPVPHVLRVIDADPITGVLTTWAVGPQFARDQPVKDVKAYHMIGFEGLVTAMQKEPVIGCRVTFLPGFCMMNLNHTALVNMLLEKKAGLHIRLEDIRILAGLP